MPAELNIDGKAISLPTVVGTEQEKAIDIRQLRAQTGYVTLDQGYMNTGAVTSSITFLDGDKGILRYRGIPIEELAEKSTFIETAYLLIYGQLPTKTELERWRDQLTRHSMIHEDMKRFFDGYPSTAHPMAVLSAMICSLSSYYPESLDVRNKEMNDINIARLISKVRTIAAYTYKKSIGQPMVYPKNSLSYCANFLNMMFSVPAEPYEVDEDVVKVLNQLFILHADHEQNCSTSTVRLVGSAQANVFASVAAGVCALWGPLHGGRQPGGAGDAGGHPEGRRRPQQVRRAGQEEGLRLPADGLRPPGVQELRPAGQGHQGRLRQGAAQAEAPGSAAGHRPPPGRGGAEGSLLRRPEAVPERRLLQRPHLPGARHPDQHVHRHVRHRPATRAGWPTGKR